MRMQETGRLRAARERQAAAALAQVRLG